MDVIVYSGALAVDGAEVAAGMAAKIADTLTRDAEWYVSSVTVKDRNTDTVVSQWLYDVDRAPEVRKV